MFSLAIVTTSNYLVYLFIFNRLLPTPPHTHTLECAVHKAGILSIFFITAPKHLVALNKYLFNELIEREEGLGKVLRFSWRPHEGAAPRGLDR